MIEKTVVSFGYIPESKVMMAKTALQSHEAILNFAKFEESYLSKQANKSSAKKNTRRRVEKSRNALRCSDVESDTSDGFTVNSCGSGHSGDWGPPKMRQKPKYSRKRHEQRASFTDSGISMTKTDSGDLSELSYQYDREKFFIQRPCDPYSDSSHERYSRLTKQHIAEQVQKQRTQSKIEATNHSKASVTSSTSVPQNKNSLKRASSCSALPSNIKPLDRHNPRVAHRVEQQQQVEPCTNIEDKENAILQQCYRNEGVSPDCADVGCNYLMECTHHTPSRFPLPDHLNYPLNKYYKSESNLHRLQPLKKIRSSLRKLKTKTQNIHLSTPDRYENYSIPRSSIDITTPIDTLDSSYLDYIHHANDNDNSEAIMARLAKSPNSSNKKAWMKKIFKWGLGKSYVPKSKKGSSKNKDQHTIIYSEGPSVESNRLKKRSHSTRSIPEALMNIWSKVHEPLPATTTATHEFEFTVPTTLARASSMPSIATHRISKPQTTDVIYFNEKGPELITHNKNIFKHFFKPIESLSNSQQQPPQKQTTPLKGGCDVITGVLGQTPIRRQSAGEIKMSAELSSPHENNNQLPPRGLSTQQNIPQYYTSCQDMRMYQVHQQQNMALPPSPQVYGHCHCCSHTQYGNFVPEQHVMPAHHQQHVMPAHHHHHAPGYAHNYQQQQQLPPPPPQQQHQQYHYHDNNDETEDMIQPIAYYTKSDYSVAQPTASVVAPLDMKVSVERRAERRKICDMVFDTFV